MVQTLVAKLKALLGFLRRRRLHRALDRLAHEAEELRLYDERFFPKEIRRETTPTEPIPKSRSGP